MWKCSYLRTYLITDTKYNYIFNYCMQFLICIGYVDHIDIILLLRYRDNDKMVKNFVR